jgi:two-component system, NarL family, invasion response regulator UvrY
MNHLKNSISPPTDAVIRVLIADDHPLIAQGLTQALTHHGQGRLHVVGQVLQATHVVEQYQKNHASVVVLDVRFAEGATGLNVARQLLIAQPKARIVFFSQFDQDALIYEAYRLGGAAFITKDCDAQYIAQAIEQVVLGEPYFLPHIAERLALLSVQGDGSPQSKLNSRELEVFRLMALGLTNVEIAKHLELSLKTISTESQRIKDQLGITRPAEITRLAMKYLLIEA